MSRLITFLLLAFFLYIAWPALSTSDNAGDLKGDINSLVADPAISDAIEKVSTGLGQMIEQLNSTKSELSQNRENDFQEIGKPALKVPASQTFSIHNVEIGDAKAEVEKHLGSPKRSSVNEYGSKWNTYHENFQNFIMVSYSEDERVNAIYTNQDLISAKNGIKYGSPKEAVRKAFGEPLSQLKKGRVYYQFQKERDYDVYQRDEGYITIFYDQHRSNTVTAVQIISEQLELNKQGFYSQGSETLKEGFEFQLFDLTNASRVNHRLSVLSWDDRVKETARKHSFDMAENAYFSHTNLEGESPFDRMAKDDIVFAVAGENLAYGQFSSIFAHEGLMNSAGHRENILKPDFQLLGVGVAFGPKHEPYFTENFYTKRKF